MNLSTLRKRSAATALVLSVAVLGAACAEGEDATSVGQEQTETTTDEGTEPADDAATDETDGDAEGEAPADGKTGRVGAKYAANVFTLVGTDETEDGKIVAITDGSVDVRTSQTVVYEGEVLDFTDAKVEEALGAEQFEQLKPDFEKKQVLLVSSYSVQE